MKVIAAKGTQCPKEGKPREYITDAEAVEVPDNSSYYRRLVNDGSLLTAGAGDPGSDAGLKTKPQTLNSKTQKTGGKE